MSDLKKLADAKDKIVKILIYRVPNDVPGWIIQQHLPHLEEDTMKRAITALLGESKIVTKKTVSDALEGSYGMRDLTPYPVRRTIALGEVALPRILSTDSLHESPEIFNETVERLSEYTASLEKRFSEMVQEQLRRYWGTIVSVFGVFVSILAFILVSVPKLNIDPNLPLRRIALVDTVEVLPLAIVLAIFIIVLRKVVR